MGWEFLIPDIKVRGIIPYSAFTEMGSEFLIPDIKVRGTIPCSALQKWVQNFWSLYLFGEKETALIKTSALNQMM